MYPQVRVRNTEDQVSEQVAAAYLLKVLESLSLKGPVPAKTSHADQESREKVDPNRPGVTTSPNSKDRPTPTPALKGKNTNGSDEDKRNNIRASSVPPPRAVLSSPDNDGIVGHQNKRIQGRRIAVNGQEPDNFGNDNQHRAQTRQSPYTHTKASPGSIRGKRLPFNSNAQNQPRTRICDDKTVKHSSLESSSYDSASRLAGCHNAYPKIKCSQAMKSNSKVKKI